MRWVIHFRDDRNFFDKTPRTVTINAKDFKEASSRVFIGVYLAEGLGEQDVEILGVMQEFSV